MAEEMGELRVRLEQIAEELADLAIEALRESLDPAGGEPGRAGYAARERRITRARRAVERAAGILSAGDDRDDAI